MRTALVAALWLSTLGCVEGNGTLANTGGMGGSTVGGGSYGAAICSATCTRRVRCDGATIDCTQDQSVTACLQTAGVQYDALFRSDFLQAFSNCLSTTCGSSDSCLSTWFMGAGIDLVNNPDLQRCRARHTECQNQGSSWSDDNCAYIPLFKPAPAAQARACLDRACTEISACLRQVFGG